MDQIQSKLSQVDASNFTQEQYNHIVQLLTQHSPQVRNDLVSNTAENTAGNHRTVQLPNGDETQDLSTGKVKEIGKEENWLYWLLSKDARKLISLAAQESNGVSNIKKRHLVFKDTHSTLDHSAQWSSIPIYQSEQCTSVEGRSRTTNDETREEDQHNGELRVGLNEEPLHELRAELNEKPLQVSVQPPTDNNQQNRKSVRSSKPPIWMKDFVSPNIHKGSGYGIQNYMSYDKISNKYNAYIAAFSNNIEPKSYAEATADPRRREAIVTPRAYTLGVAGTRRPLLAPSEPLAWLS
ncbi:hypothetical protein KY285_025386 [Solanum tuberosum]|nr:hypothetical protein KY285_025386 [Solanum tuberosum]